jgi:hypothetical protein
VINNLPQRLLYVPIVCQGLASVVLFLAALNAWGAADEVGNPSWMPTFGGVLVATTVGIASAFILRRVQRALAVPVHVRTPRVLAGLAGSVLLTFMQLAYALRINLQDYYQGSYNSFSATYDARFTTETFVISMMLVVLVGPVMWALIAVDRLYRGGFDPIAPEVEGPDPMGRIMSKS